MMEKPVMRKQAPLDLHTTGNGEDGDSGFDSAASNSTEISDWSADRVYEVEQILAEKKEGRSSVYLIKWADYPESRASWEPEDCILDKNIISNWKITLAQQKAGKLKVFDVAAWESKIKKLAKEKEERKSRRKEKHKTRVRKSSSGVPSKVLAGEDSDDEPIIHRKQQKAIRSIQSSDEDDQPLSFSRRASTENKPKKKKQKTILLHSEESESPDEVRKEARGNRERKMSENTRENQKRPEARKPLERSTDSPDTGSPLQRTGEFPPLRTASRDSIQEANRPPLTSTGNQGAARGPSGRPRGRPPGSGRGATRGGGRGRGRSGAVPDTGNVFLKSEKPRMRKKSLSHSLSGAAADSDAINSPELSRNLSHVRKLEIAGRAKADRAPDLSVLGGLIKPGEIQGSRAYPILKPRDFRQPDGQSRQPSNADVVPTTSAPPSRRSSTNRVRFMDDSDDGSGAIFEEPVSMVQNQSSKDQSGRDIPSKGQIVGHGIDQSEAPGQLKIGSISIKPKPLHRTPTTSNDGTPNQRSFQQPLAPRVEPIPNTTSTQIAPSQAGSPSNPLESVHPALDRKTNTIERKKVSLSEYNAKQRIEKGGNLVKQASFGTLDIQQTQIAFNGIQKSSQEPWVKDISSLDAINFVHLCSATNFQAQPIFVRAKVLGHGSIAANSEDIILLDRLSEHLRLRLGGLVFDHHSIAILLFPTRLDEWKFLEKPDVPNNIALRYHIFELPEFCPTISGPSIGFNSSEATLGPPYWTSAVEFLCALSYESLLVTIPPQEKKEIDRDHFFLLIPENETPSPRFLTTWLKSCKPSCKVLGNQKPGSWMKFIEHAKNEGSYGTVLVHESLIPQIPKLPQLQRLFAHKGYFAFFSINSCPSPRTTLSLSLGDSIPRATVTTRLFPRGAVFFLAPSLLIADPKNVFKFLRWFKNKQEKGSIPNTYKLVGCHGMREFIMDTTLEKVAERRELFAQGKGQDVEPEAVKRGLSLDDNKSRSQIYTIINKIMDKADASLLPYYDWKDLDEEESPIILAPEYIALDDERKLLLWFAGWALLNLDKYKRFWVIGTDPTNIHKAVRISPTNNTAETPISVVTDPVNAVPPSSPHENGVRWKKTGFTAVTEVAPAPLFSTVATGSRSSMLDDTVSPLTRSPNLHQVTPSEKSWHRSSVSMDISPKLHEPAETSSSISMDISPKTQEPAETGEPAPDQTQSQGHDDMEDLMKYEELIDEFIARTGSSDELAIHYLGSNGANLPAAVESYRQAFGAAPQLVPTQVPLSRPLPPPLPQMDSAVDTSGQSSPNVTSGSRPSSRSGVVTEEDGRKIVPSSIRSNGSTRKEINIRPGYVPPEDKEVWRSPTVLSMLPRNVRQNTLAHIGNSRQRTTNGELGAPITKDESGDVVMSEAHQNSITSPPESKMLPPQISPSDDEAAKRRTESDASAVLVTEDECSPSGASSPTQQEMQKPPSSLPMQSTKELFKGMEEVEQKFNHIRVLGIKEAINTLHIK